MNYKIINSGSDGNAIVIENFILIDCGVSFKRLQDVYSKLQLVLLTHIHSDHFNKRTIKKLANERPTLRFVCCKWLYESLLECEVDKSNIDVIEISRLYQYSDTLCLSAIKLYHDVENCGYRVFLGDKRLIYATDTNTLSGISAKDYDLYLIEGNYENEEELHSRAENEIYENRVKNTHLSKEQASEWLLKNIGEHSKYVYMHEHKNRKKE